MIELVNKVAAIGLVALACLPMIAMGAAPALAHRAVAPTVERPAQLAALDSPSHVAMR